MKTREEFLRLTFLTARGFSLFLGGFSLPLGFALIHVSLLGIFFLGILLSLSPR